MRVAFKEWAIVVDALGRGDQILILRKGGIHEGRQGFRPEHAEFLLFPTAFHQQVEKVTPSARKHIPNLPPNQVSLGFFAQVTTWKKIENLETALSLKDFHIWSEETIRERFDWGKEDGIYALIVRVHRLPTPLTLPLLQDYRGCKSWVTLPEAVNLTGSNPVLSDDAFEACQTRLLELLADKNPFPV